MVKWMAVLYGILTAIVLGLLSGLGVPFTDLTLPALGAGLSGFIAGGVAGYFAHEGLGSGALHGLLATALGGVVGGLVLLVFGTIAAGLVGLSASLIFLLWVVATSIPGIIGGAVGGFLGVERKPAGEPAT